MNEETIFVRESDLQLPWDQLSESDVEALQREARELGVHPSDLFAVRETRGDLLEALQLKEADWSLLCLAVSVLQEEGLGSIDQALLSKGILAAQYLIVQAEGEGDAI